MKEMLQFKKQRELGSILEDIFKFVRMNYKVLFGLVLRIAGPALLILILSFIFYVQGISGFMEDIVSSSNFDGFGFGITMVVAIVCLILSVLVYYALIYGTIMLSIQSYMNNNGVIDKSEVIAGIKERFWGLLGLSFLVGIMIFVGFMVCGIPGIYLATVLSTVYAVYIFENRTVSDSISYCFELIKGEWWMTFATLFVTLLLYYLLTFIFQVPATIYSLGDQFLNAEEITNNPAEMFDIGYIILNVISLLGQYLLYIIIVIATAFVYFNLNEKKNFTGTIETIESLGNREE